MLPADNLFIGLMSGTSLDGVDAVLIQCHPSHISQPALNAPISILAHHAQPFSKALRDELWALQAPADNELHRMAMAAQGLVRVYAQAVKSLLSKTTYLPEDITAIGAHGQTIRHRPELGYTYQINAPALLVEQTGIAVISDFRSRDIAAGGQGAPLVPMFHHHAFGHTTPRVIVNLGGIANITVLEPGAPPRGTDTGPANMLMDNWCELHSGQPYDESGQWGAQGQCNDALLQLLIDSEPWFKLSSPKSTGRDLFHVSWLRARLDEFKKSHLTTSTQPINPADIQATLQRFTSSTISMSIEALGAQGWPIYVCGGGAYNKALLECIAKDCRSTVCTTDALDMAPEHVEAAAFAWLAWAHLNKVHANEPQATGARGTRILGAYWPVN